MAVQTVVMNGNATTAVHPFFSRPKVDDRLDHVTLNNPSHGSSDQSQSVPTVGRPGIDRIAHQKFPPNRHQLTLSEALDREHCADANNLASGTNEGTEDGGRPRKMRKTSHTEPTAASTSLEGKGTRPNEQIEAQHVNDNQEPHDTADVIALEPTALPELRARTKTPRTPPKKMLRLNASGKFSSPIKNLAKDEEMTSEQPKKRGRPRKSREAPVPKQLVVRMRYAATSESSTGAKIAQILTGDLRIPLLQMQPAPRQPRTPRKAAKATHPFFNDKSKTAKPLKVESPRKTAAITPGKLRVQAKFERGAPIDDHVPIAESALLKDRLMVKHPGAREPLWPAKGMAHVRGDVRHTPYRQRLHLRKQKHKLATADNSLLRQFAERLLPEPDPALRADGFYEPRADLRIPEKLLIPGAEIATLVLKDVSAPLAAGPPDELALESLRPTHPAVEHAYKRIPSYLSAFDHLQGEPHSWTQKYAPERSELVLQPNMEMQVLKTWLQSLAVNAVDGAVAALANDNTVKRKKKRKIRHSELDDFIVDEGDDIRSLGAISDAEHSSQSLVQSQVDKVRASNAVLISGPHGCGKTAAVYAVAKELQYRVFEISSADRRAGKDVLDKIGNVTENHIVKGHNADQPALPISEDVERVDAAFKKDLESGRQGKMNAFFKPKAAKAVPKSKPVGIVKAKVVEHVQNAIKRAKEQQQSLILLEEVDILFKEDKEFWTTILKLIQTSKRPFIMTCNDEDLVPMQAMSIHAVLRFVPTDADTAIDYLLLVAAREGHLLGRCAISSLWHDSNHDLRQALSTLDFWCRMGVGDVRSGLGWMYQRWPPGSDLDAKGRPLRVVSKGTYLAGMGSAQQPLHKTSLQRDNEQASLEDACIAAVGFSRLDLVAEKHNVDPTLPELPTKQRAHYIEGLALLDGQETVDYTGLQSEIHAAATALSSSLYARWHEAEEEPAKLSRKDFGAFDALAYPASSITSGMESSVLDGPFQPVVTEVAPYVRQVVRYEQMLQAHRVAMGGTAKRARTTRAARSALEGGQRQLTRREFWWDSAGDLSGVLATAGVDWHCDDGRGSTPFSMDGSIGAAE